MCLWREMFIQPGVVLAVAMVWAWSASLESPGLTLGMTQGPAQTGNIPSTGDFELSVREKSHGVVYGYRG